MGQGQGQQKWPWPGPAQPLDSVDVTVTDGDIILAITSGLPHLYDSFLISLDAASDDNYMLPHVIAHLVNEYQCQHGHKSHDQSMTRDYQG